MLRPNLQGSQIGFEIIRLSSARPLGIELILYYFYSPCKKVKMNDIQDIVQKKERELLDTLKFNLRRKHAELETALRDNELLKTDIDDLEIAHNNNLKVIEELEQQNAHVKAVAKQMKKVAEQRAAEIAHLKSNIQNLTGQHAQEIGYLKEQITNLNGKLSEASQALQVKLQQTANTDAISQKLELKHKIEIEQISNMAANKIKNQEIHFNKTLNNYKAQTEATITQLKNRNEIISEENRQLMNTVNSLKQSLLELETKYTEEKATLQRALKDSEYTRQVYENELSNVKKCSEDWENSLKDKIKVLQLEKEEILHEFSEFRMKRKDKNKEMKTQFANKVDELVREKEHMGKKYEEVLRHLKVENDKLEYANNQLKKQVQDQEKQKRTHVSEAEHKYQFLIKSIDQDKKSFKNELAIKDLKIEELMRQISENNVQASDQKATIQKLKYLAESKNGEIEKLKDEINSLKMHRNKQHDNPMTNDFELHEYSKAASSEMGVIDDDWLIRRSNVGRRSNLKDAFDSKKIEALQSENNELKDEIANMDRKIRQVNDLFSQKIDLKDKEIKMSRDEVYLLKDKLNEKEMEGLKLKERIQQAEFENIKSQELLKQSSKYPEEIEKLKKNISELKQEIQSFKSILQDTEQERDMLLEISNQQKAEIRELQSQQFAKIADESSLTPISIRQAEKSALTSEIIGEFNKPISPINKNNDQRRHIPSFSGSGPIAAEKDQRKRRDTETQPQSQKRTETLTNLIKERRKLAAEQNKLAFQIKGEEARFQERETRAWGAETESQKRVYQKLRRSKEKSNEREVSPSQRL